MLLSSSNRKYPPSPLLPYFSVVVCLRCIHHILSRIAYMFRENREFVFIIIVQFMMSANSRIRFGLQIVLVCLYSTPFHYPSLCKLTWRHWTHKMPVRYILTSVWVRLSIFSQLSIIQYVGLCVFSLPISLVMIERISILCFIIIKSEVWIITHCLMLGHETMVCAVCLSIFVCYRLSALKCRFLNTAGKTYLIVTPIGHDVLRWIEEYFKRNTYGHFKSIRVIHKLSSPSLV